MAAKRYPIGTKIKYIGHCGKCKNKIGKIVGVSEHLCWLNLPKSTCCPKPTSKAYAKWSEIMPIVAKNQQLLFSFME